MSTEYTVTKSPLDKPLHQLTEDDISQLTREDCRRFLKDKGMRRPSWNKSQAIQQVISLKKLLETTEDSDAGDLSRRKRYIARPESENPTTRVQKGNSADTEISASAEELSVPNRRADPDEPEFTGDLSGRLVAVDNDSIPLRVTGVTDEPVAQMTIFYCGQVNVYDDVPADKARALMQLASSPHHLPQDAPFDDTGVVYASPCNLPAPSMKVGSDSSAMLLSTLHTVRMTDNFRLQREESNTFQEDSPAAEASLSRKASVQRYLEKRKDRFKSKRKVGTPACASMDVYLSHQIRNQSLNEQPNRSGTCSPPPLRPPNTPKHCS